MSGQGNGDTSGEEFSTEKYLCPVHGVVYDCVSFRFGHERDVNYWCGRCFVEHLERLGIQRLSLVKD